MAVMKQQGQRNENARSRRTGNHPHHRRLDALTRTALVVAIGMGLPALAHAGRTSHIAPSVHDGHQSTVVQAKNGTPVVNIVAPGKHGISHNEYTRFDVGQKGLILNNSADISKTKLAGYVTGNKHLVGTGPASIILNEVVSAQPSQLDGYMEIAGTPAELIIANPNGIACDGCGFINTPRAVLTTGQPVVDSNGRLTGFRVTQGGINISGTGLDASHIDRVDLLARAVDINAKLWAQQLNVVAGANRVALDNLSATPIDGLGDKPDMAIDVAALGGMYAHAIYLVGTEAGVGVNIQGVVAAQAGDFTLTSAGKVMLDGQTTATETVTVGTPQSVAVHVHGVLASGGAMDVHGHALNLAGTVYSGNNITLDATGDIHNEGQLQAHGGQLVVSAGGEVTNTAEGVMYAGKDVTLDASGLANAGGIEAARGVHVDAAQTLSNQGILQADQAGLSLVAQTLANTGTLSAQGNVDATAGGQLASSGQLIAGGSIALAANALVTAGVVQAGHALTLKADSLLNKGKLYAMGGAWQATVGGDAVNASEGDVYGTDGVSLKATTLTNHGLMEASGALAVQTGGAFANTGTVQSDHAALKLTAASLRNAGTLSAATDMTLNAATTLDNTAAVVAGGNITLEGHDLDLAGSIKAGKALELLSHGDASINGKLYAMGGSLQATVAGTLDNQISGDIYGRQGVTLAATSLSSLGHITSQADLSANVGSLDNQGQMRDVGHLELSSRKSITNSGTVQSGAALTISAGGNVDNATGGLFYATTKADVHARSDWHNTGNLYAADALDLAAGMLHNTGVMRSGAGMDVTIRQAASNAGTAYAVGQAQWHVGGVLTNNGVLASAADTRIVADSVQGDGTFAAGLESNGSLGARGNLTLQTTGALQAGGRNLAARNLNLSGSKLDLAGSQTFAGAGADLVAGGGDIILSGARLTATETASFQANGTLVNGGSTAVDGGQINANAITLKAGSLDNRHGHLEQSGDGNLGIHLDGAFDNADGLLATNADNLSIQAASFDNTGGNIQHAGNGQLSLTSATSLDNRSGTIASNGNVVFTLGGALDNRGGSIGILGDVTLQADTLDNRKGALSGNNLALKLARSVKNQGGTLQSAGSLNLYATTLANDTQGIIKATGDDAIQLVLGGALTNAAGAFIEGNGEVTVKVAQLTNAGQLYAGHALHVTTTSGDLDNGQGNLQAMGSLWLDSADALTNQHGRIEAGAGQSDAMLTATAANFDNQGGRLANAGSGTTTLTVDQAIANQDGVLGGQGNVQIDAADLVNTGAGTLVAGRDLDLALAQLDNAGGTAYAARNLVWKQGNASLDNTGGHFGAGGDLTLLLGGVDNSKGNLDAEHDVTLNLAHFDGPGRVVAGNDLGLTLPGDYVNGKGNILKANHDLSLTVGGQFDNPADATLEAVRALTIHAANIDNAGNAHINSAATSLVAIHALTNEGRIEGDSVILKAAAFTNTGSVMGGDVTAQAGKLVNGRDLGKATGNDPYQTALIAATHSLDLYVSGTLLNQDASLYTLGDMTLAADAAGHRSQTITNRSGDIEAGGNIIIAADQITNKRRYYQFKTFKVSGNTIVGWDGHVAGMSANAQVHDLRAMMLPPTKPPDGGGGTGGSGTPNTRTEVTYLKRKDDPLMDQTCNSLPSGWRCKPGALIERLDTWTVTSATVLTAASAESNILADKNMSISGSLTNDASTVSAGNNLLINQVRQSGKIANAIIGGESVRNMAHAPTVDVEHTWTESITEQRKERCAGKSKHCWRDRGPAVLGPVNDTKPPADGDYSFVTLKLGPTLSAHITAGNQVDINAHDIDNTVVDKDDQPVKGATVLGSNGDGHTVSGPPVQDVGSVGKSSATGGNVTLGHAPGAGSDVAFHGHVTTNAPQTVASLTGPGASVSLPQSGLYTINKKPDSSYLVETDPRFADYANFISSNYLLSHLGYDPAAVGKRLGDGFYEERQVLDQITDLTGRRFLTADTDALNQYRALMDNAVTAAKKFNLSVGVALTADQMADLTHDMVWLVSEKVDGQSVLVPVVYLSQSDAQHLTQSGAVIAGRHVVLHATGDITNNGSIVASQSATLKADNLLNSGTLAAGGTLGIQAAHDILNQGGIIRGAGVSLVAGGDVVSRADIGAVHLGGVNLGDLNTGGITATHSLAISAGRDLSLDQVSLEAGDNMVLAAGRDLSVQAGTLHAGTNLAALAGRDIALTATTSHTNAFDGHTLTTTTTHQVSQLDAGQNLTVVAGHDLTSQGSQLKAGGTLGVSAGRDIHLGTVTDHTYTVTHAKHGHTNSVTTIEDDTVHGTTLDGIHSVALAAGRDLTSQGAQLASGGKLSLSAGRNIDLNAAYGQQATQSETSTKHTRTLTSTRATHALGTSLTATDDMAVKAGAKLTTEGATLESDTGAVNLLAGGLMNIGTATEQSTSTYRSINHSGGFLHHKVTAITDDVHATHAEGTVVSGDTVSLRSGRDMTLQGATVVGSNGVMLDSGGAINVEAAADTRHENYQKTVKTSGFLSGGGIGFTFGKRTQKVSTDTNTTALDGSLVGTINGNSNVNATTSYTQVASSLLSQHGDVNVLAGDVNILAGEESGQQTRDTLFKQGGLTVAVGGGALGALVGSAETGKHLLSTARHAHDGRVNTMAALNAAITAKQGYGAAKGIAQQFSDGVGGANLSVSLTYGQSKSTSHSLTDTTQAVASTVSGRNVTLVASGDHGTVGDLDVTGSTIEGSQDVTLGALHNLNITSAQNTYDTTTTNHSSSGSLGVAASFGENGVAFGVTASAAVAHGDANFTSVQQENSQVTAGQTLRFVSGNDTTLAGAVAKAGKVIGKVGGDLTLRSLQDTGHSHSSQTSMGASGTFGYGASVSVSYSHSSSHSDYANVVQQTGIEAGDGGYDIHVGGNTNLVGALLTSDQAAIDANRNALTTGTLTASAIHNHGSASASSMGLGASLNTGATFGQALNDDPGNDNYLAANGGKYGLTKAVIQNTLDHGSASGSANGEALSALSPGQIVITDPSAQRTQSTSQLVTGLEANSHAVTNTTVALPDVVAVQRSAQNEQTANNLMFNAGSWATNQGALKDALAALQRVIGCKIMSGGKHCKAQPLSGTYALAPGSTLDTFLNGIMNNSQLAANNAGDLSVLYTTPASAGNTVVVNDYSPKISGIGSLLAGLWNSINSNHAGGALGTTAGAKLAANVAGQIKQANNEGAHITFNPMAHSDGTAQLMLSMEQYPKAWTNANGSTPTLVMLAEPSANAKAFQKIVNANGENAGIVFSANSNDQVPRSVLIGDNPSTGGNPNGLFLAGPLTYGSGGPGLILGKPDGASIHSDIGYSAMVTPVATDNGRIEYPWGPSDNAFVPGHVPVFSKEPKAPSDTPRPHAYTKYGGDRTFALLPKSGAKGPYTITFPSISVAGSTAWAPNIALLTWPTGPAANLGAALAAKNGLPVNGSTPSGSPVFAPGSSKVPKFLLAPKNTKPATKTTPNSMTPAQQRCLILTGGAPQCL